MTNEQKIQELHKQNVIYKTERDCATIDAKYYTDKIADNNELIAKLSESK